MRAVLAMLLLVACGAEPVDEVVDRPPAERPPPPRFDCALGGPARSFDGRAPALAQDAVVAHDDDGNATLHRLDAPSSPALSLPGRVLALATHDGGWLAVLPSRVVQLETTGEIRWEAGLEVEATDAALALDDRALEDAVAWLALRDAEDEISLRHLDLRSHALGPAASVGRGRGRLIVAPGRGGWVGPAEQLRFEDAPPPETGNAVALVGADVLYTDRDRTGVWVGDVRVTRADVAPEALVATRIGGRLVLAYAADADLFVQPADRATGAVGQPVLVAASATPAQIVATGERFWVAWERERAVEVRAGECRGD